MTKRYKYYQPNKKDIKDEYGDCVVRALAKAMNKDWLQVFDELIPIARSLQCMPSDRPCFQAYLESNGFTYIGVSNKKGSTRPTVASFAAAHKEGIYVLRPAHHIVAAVSGYYYDIWDCGDKSLYGYWEKRKEKV